jgi:pimeloyl-ACP methyl ester carboxylesterase
MLLPAGASAATRLPDHGSPIDPGQLVRGHLLLSSREAARRLAYRLSPANLGASADGRPVRRWRIRFAAGAIRALQLSFRAPSVAIGRRPEGLPDGPSASPSVRRSTGTLVRLGDLKGRRIVRASVVAGLAALATALCLATSTAAGSAASAHRARLPPVSGRFSGKISIGHGRTLYLQCAGRGSPTVVLESGIHDSSDTWTLSEAKPPVVGHPTVFAGVARFTHVCMYDRPGTIRYTNPPTLTTRSTPVKMPRTLTSMASDLHALLTRARVPGPYVLVGHSYGGLIVRLFAQTHPKQTAGLVFVDAFGTNIRRLFGPRLWPQYVHLLNHPGTALDNDPGFETVNVDEAIEAVQHARPLPRVPLAVISKTEPFATSGSVPKYLTAKLEQAWPNVQAALVKLEPQTPHILATGSDHYVQINDPDLTTSIIRLVLDRARARDRR